MGDCVKIVGFGAGFGAAKPRVSYDDMFREGAQAGREAVCRAALERGADPDRALLTFAKGIASWGWQNQDHDYSDDMVQDGVDVRGAAFSKVYAVCSLLREHGASEFEGMLRAALLSLGKLSFNAARYVVAIAKRWIAEEAASSAAKQRAKRQKKRRAKR